MAKAILLVLVCSVSMNCVATSEAYLYGHARAGLCRNFAKGANFGGSQ